MSSEDMSGQVAERDLRWRFLKLEDKLDHIQLTLGAILEELANLRQEARATTLDAHRQNTEELRDK